MKRTEFNKLYNKVYTLITDYFKDKVDKGGHLYTKHLYDVAEAVHSEMEREVRDIESSLGTFYHKAYIVALLHDILEDTDCPIEELSQVIDGDEEILKAVQILTRKPTDKYYFDYIEKIKYNDIARIVKIYDLENNMDIRRLSKFNEVDMRRIHKYWHCWKFLKGEIDAVSCNNTIHPNRLLR